MAKPAILLNGKSRVERERDVGPRVESATTSDWSWIYLDDVGFGGDDEWSNRDPAQVNNEKAGLFITESESCAFRRKLRSVLKTS